MTKKFHILVIILTFAFFTIPAMTYACGAKTSKTEKSCCKKDKTTNANKKNCCKNQPTKNGNGCEGKCNDSNCSCQITHTAIALPFWTETNFNTYLTHRKRINNYYNETYLSDGFTSILFHPKIDESLAMTAKGLSN